jgi:hypothetical protein
VWIIRNGVNDAAQNEETDFTIENPGIGEETNWNGAVRYEIAAKTPTDGSELEIRDGKFLGPADSNIPDITFTTDGYDETAEVYYAVVPKRVRRIIRSIPNWLR